MNFKKLQEMQRALDDAILKEKPEMTAEERFEKTCVALSVEVAELANTAELFKFWKENKGKVDKERFLVTPGNNYYDKKTTEYNSKKQAHKLTLVEEASDCLHFILSLANQSDYELFEMEDKAYGLPQKSLEERYKEVQQLANFWLISDKKYWVQTLSESFFDYIRELAINQKELEQAYYDKNEVNYQRLEQGY